MEKFATFSGLVGLLFIILYIFCISILTADWLFSLFLKKNEWYPQELLQKKENVYKMKLKTSQELLMLSRSLSVY